MDKPGAEDVCRRIARRDEAKKMRREARAANKRMHSPEAVDILKGWLLSAEHVEHPYPTEDEKKVGQFRAHRPLHHH